MNGQYDKADDNGTITSFHDVDQYFSRRAGIPQDPNRRTYLVSNLAIMKNGNCQTTPFWPDVAICQNNYAKIKLVTDKEDRLALLRRSDGPSQTLKSADPNRPSWQLPIITNQNITYQVSNLNGDAILTTYLEAYEIPRGDALTLFLPGMKSVPVGQSNYTLTRNNTLRDLQNSTTPGYHIDSDGKGKDGLYIKLFGIENSKILIDL